MRTAPFGLQGDALAPGQRRDIRFYQAGRPVRHHIVGHAALKFQNVSVQLAAHQVAVEPALFAVAHRELGVRRTAKVRRGKVLEVVRHIRHAGLLVGAQQRAHTVAQGHGVIL